MKALFKSIILCREAFVRMPIEAPIGGAPYLVASAEPGRRPLQGRCETLSGSRAAEGTWARIGNPSEEAAQSVDGRDSLELVLAHHPSRCRLRRW